MLFLRQRLINECVNMCPSLNDLHVFISIFISFRLIDVPHQESPLLITQSIQHTSVYIGAAKSCCVWISFEKKCVHSKFSPHRMFGKHRLFQTKLPPHLRSDRSWFEYIRNLNIILDFASILLSFSASFSHQQLTETHGLIFGPFRCFCIANTWESAWRHDPCREQLTHNREPIPLLWGRLTTSLPLPTELLTPEIRPLCIHILHRHRKWQNTQRYTNTHTHTQVTPLQCTCKHTGQCTWICMQTHTISMTISIFRRSASEIQIVIIIISRSVLPSRAAASGFTCSRSRMRKHMSWAQQ